jgi:hypothetical protein
MLKKHIFKSQSGLHSNSWLTAICILLTDIATSYSTLNETVKVRYLTQIYFLHVNNTNTLSPLKIRFKFHLLFSSN